MAKPGRGNSKASDKSRGLGTGGFGSTSSSSSGFSFDGLADLASAIGGMFGGVFGGNTDTLDGSRGQNQAASAQAAAQSARQAANMDRTRDSNSQKGGPADLQNDKNSVRSGIIAKRKKASSLYSATNGLTGSASQRTAGSGGALAGDQIKSVGLGV